MAGFTLSKHVQAPVERVFDVFTDLHHAAKRVNGIEAIDLLTEGPIGAGTRWRETRIMFGKAASEEMWISAFDPPRGYSVECDSCGAHVVSHFRFTSEEDGARVEQEFIWSATSLVAKLMSPLARLMVKPMMQAMDQDLEDLKRAPNSRLSRHRSVDFTSACRRAVQGRRTWKSALRRRRRFASVARSR
jgi:hypothetical protein